MGVDLGFSVVGSRTAQAMADTAAIDLAQDISAANQYTTNAGMQSYLNSQLAGVLRDNNSNAQLAVTFGLQQNGTWSVPSGGCATSSPPCNSVAVSAAQTVPQPFWGGTNTLVGRNGSSISCPIGGCTTCPTTACASSVSQACFSIGSDLASFSTSQSTVLNSLLGNLGSSVNITAVGYQGLASTNVSVGQIIDQSGGVLSPSNVLTTSVTSGNWLKWIVGAVNAQTSAGTCSSSAPSPAVTSALSGISTSGTTPYKLCQIVLIGNSCASGSLPFSSLSAGVNVLQMLTTMAELSNGSSGVTLGLNLSVPNVTSASIKVAVIQPPEVAYGPVGSVTDATKPCPAASPSTSTCATTAQISVTLNLNVLTLSLLTFQFGAAQGTATLDAVNCSGNAMTSTLINASTNALSASANLLGLLGGVATLSVDGVPETTPPLSYTGSVVPPSSSTTGSNPLHIGSTSPTLTVAGLSLTPGLGAALAPVLQALGVSVAEADVADLGTDCNSVQLTP
jgi:uncharacterized membrane protein